VFLHARGAEGGGLCLYIEVCLRDCLKGARRSTSMSIYRHTQDWRDGCNNYPPMPAHIHIHT
jgi:hypothetical protein